MDRTIWIDTIYYGGVYDILCRYVSKANKYMLELRTNHRDSLR